MINVLNNPSIIDPKFVRVVENQFPKTKYRRHLCTLYLLIKRNSDLDLGWDAKWAGL